MRTLNLPNFLTLLRIILIPFAGFALFHDGGINAMWNWIAWSLFFVIGLTDFFDGRIARARNQVTEFGALWDPIADKAAIGTAMVGLSIQGRLWWWVTILILFREISVTLLRLAVIHHGVIPASTGGKLKTMFQGFGVGFYILPLPAWLHLMRDAFMAVAIILTVSTGYDYFSKVLKKGTIS